MTVSNVERTLGILLAKVEGIEQSILRGDEHRSTVHRRIDEMAVEVGSMKSQFEQVKKDVADTKAVTDDVKRWKMMGMGALGATGIASSSLTAIVLAYWDEIKKALTGS